MKKGIVLLAALGLLLVAAGGAAAKKDPSPRAAEHAQTTEIQILALNDFHGNLRPPDETTSSGRIGPNLVTGVAAGGVEYLAAHVRQLEATNPNSVFVSAGDLIGATPLISALFHDEPTIEAFNLMELDYNGVGNHEFDEGVDELLRMQHGGCHPVDGCQDAPGDPDGFEGAEFDFLAANVKYKDSGETNWAINCVLDGKIVTGAAHQARLVTDIDLTISRASKDVVSATVNNVIVTRTVAKAPDLTQLVNKYAELVAPLANRPVGEATAPLTRTINAAGESSLGDVIADAQLAATKDPLFGGAVVAFMNPGGIRADLPAGPLTYGQLFSVQPFNNVLTVLSCTGAQIESLLEQQLWPDLAATPQNLGRILQVSEGFAYTWQASAPAGNKVDPATIKIGGVTVNPLQTYRVATNNFLATGGDGFSTFTGCTNPLGGEIDLDAFVRYVDDKTPPGVAPGPQNRITRVP